MVQFSTTSPPASGKEGQTSSKAESVNNSGPEKIANGSLKRKGGADDEGSRRRKRKNRRRLSLSKAARDPRDEASPISTPKGSPTRSPSPVIDFDGLSHPSMSAHPFSEARTDCSRSRNSRTS